MKKNISIFTAISLILCLSLSCNHPRQHVEGSGNPAVEYLDAPADVRALLVAADVRVVLSPFDSTQLSIRADDNVLPFVNVRIEGRKLRVGYDKLCDIEQKTPIVVTIPNTGKIVAIEALNGAFVTAESTLKSDNLDIFAADGSMLDLMVEAKGCNVLLLKGAVCKMEGRVGQMDLRAKRHARFRGEGVVAEKAKIELSGGSYCEIACQKSLDVKAKRGSELRYRGPAELGEQHLSGGATAQKVEE